MRKDLDLKEMGFRYDGENIYVPEDSIKGVIVLQRLIDNIIEERKLDDIDKFNNNIINMLNNSTTEDLIKASKIYEELIKDHNDKFENDYNKNNSL